VGHADRVGAGAGEVPDEADDAGTERKSKGILYLDGLGGMPVGPTTPIPAEFRPRIPAEYEGFLPAHPGYSVRYPCVDPRRKIPGERWVELWSVPQVTRPGKDAIFIFDAQKFNAWRVWLVESGVLPPIESDILAAGLDIAAKRVERARVNPDPEIRKDKVGKLEAELKTAKAAKVPTPADDPPRKRNAREASP